MSDRPFRVLGIQQIAVGGLDKGRLRKLWIDTLGLTVTGVAHQPSTGDVYLAARNGLNAVRKAAAHSEDASHASH